jgi:gliding motility-associated-like protein
MNRILFILLLGILGDIKGQSAFQKVYKSNGNETAYYVLENPEGFLISGFTTATNGGDKDGYLLQIDPNGEKIWERSYGGPNDDEIIIVEKGSNGGYLLFGHTQSTGSGDNDVFLIKVDDTGNTEWVRTFGGGFREVAPLFGTLITLPDGYIVSGPQYSNLSNGSDFGTYLIRLDQSGNIIWSRCHETGDENYLVANYVEGNTIYAAGNMDEDGAFATFDLNTGDFIAAKKYSGNSRESLYHLMPTVDNHLILSDHSWSLDNASSIYTWVSKVDKTGAVVWSKAYQKTGYNMRSFASPTPDGGLIIVPFSANSGADINALLIKTDAEGVVEWAGEYGTDRYETFYRGSPTLDGGFIAVGKAADINGQEHVFVVKTDSEGSIDGCCAKEVQINVIDYPAVVSTPSMYSSDPFSFNNWNNVGNVSTSLISSDFCNAVPPPPPTFDIEPATCGNPQGGAVQVIGLPSLTYSFAGGQFLPPTTYNLLAGGTYSVVVKSSNGCTQSYQVVVPFIGYNMVDTPLIETMLCANTSTVTINPTTGFTPFQYQLGTAGWGASNVFSGLEPADYTIFVQDNNGCLDTLNFTVNPDNAPQIDNVQITQADCNNPSATITVTALGGAGGYSYQIDTGQPSQPTGVFTINQSGTYTITITDQDGCTTQTPALLVDISVPEVPVFETTSVTCADQFGGSVLIMGGSSSLYSFNGGAFEPPKVYKNLVAGTYNVILKGANGCEYPYTVEIPSLVYEIAGTATIDQKPCSDGNMVVLNPSSGIAPFQYRWGTGAWSDNDTFEGNVPGTYTAYIQDSNQCKDTISFSIAPYSPLQFGGITIQNIDCLHPIGSIQLTANGGSGSGYSYSIGSGSPQNNGLFELTTPGNYTITVTDSEGCTTTTPPIIITKNVQPVATESTLDICSDQKITLPDGTTTNITGNYVFQLKAASGCDSTHTVRLEVTEASLYIPNVFHPNDDGINDWFTVYSSIDCIKSIKYLRVYDRWGSLFFERKDFPTNIDKLGWDGTIEGGKKADTGVYIYDCVLVLDSGAEVEYSGNVTVVR